MGESAYIKSWLSTPLFFSVDSLLFSQFCPFFSYSRILLSSKFHGATLPGNKKYLAEISPNKSCFDPKYRVNSSFGKKRRISFSFKMRTWIQKFSEHCVIHCCSLCPNFTYDTFTRPNTLFLSSLSIHIEDRIHLSMWALVTLWHISRLIYLVSFFSWYASS